MTSYACASAVASRSSVIVAEDGYCKIKSGINMFCKTIRFDESAVDDYKIYIGEVSAQ